MIREMICHKLHGLESLLLAHQEPPWPNGQGVGPLIRSPTGVVVAATPLFRRCGEGAMAVRQTSVCGCIKAPIQAGTVLTCKENKALVQALQGTLLSG